jgi:D-alanine-D-alanine ligase
MRSISTRSRDVLGSKTVVKPANEGSAIGVTIAHEPSELPAALEEAFQYDDSVLIEQFVPGVEVTVGVIGNDDLIALPTLEIVPEHEFYDYDSKYVPGMSRHIIPAGSAKLRVQSASGSLSRHTVRSVVGACRARTRS